MRTAIRALAITAAAALTVTGLAACSSGSSGSSGDSKTLTYWASNQGTSLQNDKEVLTPVLKKFTKETGIKVNLQVIGWNDLQNKIQTAVTSGQGPDVLNIGNTWAASLQATGAFQEFGSSEMKAIGGKDKFVKTALATGGAPGKTVTSVPLYGLAYGLYYNKKMFSDAGLKPPTTWEELTADAQKLTDPSKKVYGFSLAAGSYTENAHFAFINAAQNGGDWFDKKGDPTFTKKANVDGIKRYLDLMQEQKAVNTSNAQFDNGTQAVAAFAKGQAAMILNQNNADATIQSNGMKADQYGVVPFPAPEGGKQVASHVAGINLSIFKNTKNKDGALKFVKYMTSADTQKTLDKPYSALPVLKSAAEDTSGVSEETKTFLDIYNTKSEPLPLVPAEDQFESTVGKAMNDMFAKIATGGTVSDADIKSALQTAQDQVSQAAG
ncbi:sugar ABC transporter substrate-binding protein [Curtobacterium pusillum]|uniref:Multiple sugar transport system substrate-binding protein n=1 Tax=Curtobacterium pusillum TaxID=69373 RepID=A0AAW3T9U5_9MICO|nr:sugar ABC transporter substrate-binding protein [Curtobacterium pusillum]MBA8991829.1 multiple sugar transport system substrate-binding protein [Curtobacterium pusillum]NUU12286.1 sugar ABC transporter substrate-binding protein [Curtobacterium pusillum]GLK31270.1 sugar ABC transporter substrate-binding protein [Curtobacterium pusillum]